MTISNRTTSMELLSDNRDIFKDKTVLSNAWIPETFPHRQEQVNELINILKPVIHGNAPMNVFIWGKPGTAKTAMIKYTFEIIQEYQNATTTPKKIIPVIVNCRENQTPSKVAYSILVSIKGSSYEIPTKGLSKNDYWVRIRKEIDKTESIMLIALDECDHLIEPSKTLYELSRPKDTILNRTHSDLSLICLGNNPILLKKNLDPATSSSLTDYSYNISLSPYNADQLRDILQDRVKLSFNKDVVDDEVISLISALSARVSGNARQAIQLLAISGELTNIQNEPKIRTETVYSAKNKIEIDCTRSLLKSLPQHGKVLALALSLEKLNENMRVSTGDLYIKYKELCHGIGTSPLTQRWITHIISELDMMGLINAIEVSKGRYGRTRMIQLAVSQSIIFEELKEEKIFSEIEFPIVNTQSLSNF